ncbi:MAG: tetratricopeptide repeat protein [Planctomycetes bacterium]|nr:tetratricopeptide repeat protein [Planctomycetota bacterium]
MLNDPYSPCPCGSGKKFKWCCQPIHAQIAKVYSMDEEGQHEAALRAMDEIVAQHGQNPEVHGRKAQLLFQNDKAEEAEQTLEKAFELFPNYPFGHFLKARFRLYEGKIREALAHLRKSAEHYDPNAGDILAQIYIEIYDCEMKLNNPIAARAAAEMAMRLDPANDSIRQGIDRVFGPENPNLPVCARQAYSFKPLPPGASAEMRTAWGQALSTGRSAKLSEAITAFERLTQQPRVAPAAWYNLGLGYAWAGDNPAAVRALDQFVYTEPDEIQAAQAWALAEVLRYGQGMVDEADIIEHSINLAIRDPRAFVDVLGQIEKEGRLTGTQVNKEEGVLSVVVLDPPPPALTPELEARQNIKPGAFVALISNFVRMWNTNAEALQRTFAMFQERLGDVIAQAQPTRGPAKFLEALSEGVGFPRQAATKEETEQRIREGYEKHFEEVWIHRPLKSLGNVAPIDAAGHGVLRKKLRGLLLFLRDCATQGKYPYDPTRLERKLGLDAPPEIPAPTEDSRPRDIAALGAPELASLSVDSLGSADLDQAFQAALKLDARDIAGKFASALVQREPYPERSDRFPLYQLLISQNLADGQLDAALDHVNDGERDDCERNEGRRRNEYELRRAQVHAKRGEFADAERVYDGLIARVPTEINYRVNAAETMLSSRQGDLAMKYAREGHTAAIKQNNRDLEGHFRELMEAAQRK